MTELTLPPSPNWYCPKVIDMDSTGKLAFGARQDVHIFNTADFPPIYLGVFGLHRDRISAVALCPPHYSSPSCCSASEDGKVKVWNTETKALQHEHNTHNGKVTGLSWSSVQEDLIVSGDDKGELVVWQLNDARIQTYCPEKGGIFCLAFSPFSAACVAVGYRTGVIVLVDVKKEGTILQRLRGHDEDIQSLVWCPVTGEDFTMKDTPNFGVEGHLLASGSRDRTIRIWSTSKGRQLSLFRVPKPGGYFQRGDQDAGRGKIK
ncbi:hypothetical protein KUTeg_024713 [Tegillarca granosa]|uniref:Gem-associated protein 5 first beta-propeller domain-containing protein n=1 Tax=Tegillarca granosa TaxID=220873 RepID=A0ABQ9E3L7_TEGGR|nr:hypothetical protein KUTeg_024713 [Tegillarca granosa]